MFYVLETWQAIIIINDKWHSEKQENTEEEAKRIVYAAVKLIRAEIRERTYDAKLYPTNEDKCKQR